MNQLYKYYQHTSIIATLIVVLLFCAELTAYAKDYVNQVVLEICLYCAVCIFMFIYANKNPIRPNFTNPFWIMLFVYLLLLFIRIVADFVIPEKGFFLYKSAETVVFFYIFPIIIPAIFFYSFRFYYNIKKISFLLAIILTSCILKSIYDILNGNAVLNNDGRFDTAIFSISLGQYATSLFLLGIYLIVNEQRSLWRYIYIFFCFTGVIGVLFSGSRGPFVSLIICILFYFSSRIRHLYRLIILIGCIALCWGIIGDAMMSLNEYLIDNDIRSFDRVVTSIFSDDGLSNHTSGRDLLYKEALQLFFDNPIFGNSYLIPGKIYVHNIIIEQYMATGILGGTLFLLLNIFALISGFKLMRKNKQFAIIPMLLLQYFVFGCLSITILALFPYWICLLLTMNQYDNISINDRYRQTTTGVYNHPDI